MDLNDLLAELGMSPEPQPAAEEHEAPAAQMVAEEPASETALVLDNWSKRRGAEALEREPMRRAIPQGEPNAEEISADMLGAAFELNPELAEACTDQRRADFLGELMETAEFQTLHRSTQLDAVASEIAAAHFAKQFISLRDQPEPEEEFKKGLQTMRAASKAAQEASEEVAELQDARETLGGLGGDKAQHSPEELKAIRERFQRIKNNPQLRRIMELAGRFRRKARAQQRFKDTHGRDDVIGITYGNNLADVLPVELSQLGDEDLELDTLRRFAEGQLAMRDHKGVEPKAAGPIVVVVDESYSMNGERNAAAKAFALAMGWIAKHQKRWVMLVGFNGTAEGRFLTMAPDSWNDQALIDWVAHTPTGGTTYYVPCQTIPNNWDAYGVPKGKTDMILVTDGAFDIPENIQEQFHAWKQREKVKTFTLCIGGDTDADYQHISDRIWGLENIEVENDAVTELLSI